MAAAAAIGTGTDTTAVIHQLRTHQRQLADECNTMQATIHDLNSKIISMQQEGSSTTGRLQQEIAANKLLTELLTKNHNDDMQRMRQGILTANTQRDEALSQRDELRSELNAARTHSFGPVQSSRDQVRPRTIHGNTGLKISRIRPIATTRGRDLRQVARCS